MSRINKKSRIKGLPPKLLLQAIESHSGSYPAKFKTTSDGITGIYNVFFDDTKIINFVTGNINFGSGVELSLLKSGSYVNLGQDMSSSLTGSGAVRKGIADSYIDFNDLNAPGFVPFKENLHFDSKTLTNNDFYATGSAVDQMAGQDFTSPLWSKTKIVIDLTPKTQHSVAIRNFTSGTRNYPMMYWNNVLKVWEGIGTGKEFSHADYFHAYGNTLSSTVKNAYQKFLDEQTIGFANGYFNNYGNNVDADTFSSQLPKNAGVPVDNFLFPQHNKFAGTGSNLIEMSQYINQPFILEKMVLEISCAFDSNRAMGIWHSSIGSDFIPLGKPSDIVCNFFILNQTNGHKETTIRNTTVYSGSITETALLSSSTDMLYFNSKRELVTWGDVVHVPVYGSTDNLVQDEFVNLTSINSTTRQGIFKDRSGVSFDNVTYAGNTDEAQILANAILGSSGRELKFGNISGFSGAYPISVYAAAHPEFNSVTGGNGTQSGQETADDSTNHQQYPYWTGRIQLSMSCKAPLKKDNIDTLTLWDYSFNFASVSEPKKSSHGILVGSLNSGRGFNNKTSGRDFKNSLRNADVQQQAVNSLASKIVFSYDGSNSAILGVTQSVNGYSQQKINNPYLLLPTDKLIFGWQLPIHNIANSANPAAYTFNINFAHTLGPQLTFANAPAKITLYGSYVKEGKEYHDTLNQQLVSNAIHEIIGD